MSFMRNIFAVIGLISLIGLMAAAMQVQSVIDEMNRFDDRAIDIYSGFIQKAYESGSAIDALAYKVKVNDNISAADLDASILNIASELNIANVGELYLSRQVELLSGKPYRYVKIYLLCNAMTAASILNYNDAFSSFLPCKLSVVENAKGELWIYTLNLDLLIHGGQSIPPALKAEIIKVRDILNQIMQRAAAGEF